MMLRGSGWIILIYFASDYKDDGCKSRDDHHNNIKVLQRWCWWLHRWRLWSDLSSSFIRFVRLVRFVNMQYTIHSIQYLYRSWSWSHLRSSLIRFVRLRNADRWILCSLQTELSSDIRHNHIIINIISTTTKTNTVKSWSLKFQMTNFYFGFWTFTVTRRGFFDWSNWFLCQTRFISIPRIYPDAMQHTRNWQICSNWPEFVMQENRSSWKAENVILARKRDYLLWMLANWRNRSSFLAFGEFQVCERWIIRQSRPFGPNTH